MTEGCPLTEAARVELLADTQRLAELARAEDLGRGDITSLVAADQDPARFRLLMKQAGVVAGQQVAGTVLKLYGPGLEIRWADRWPDGALVSTPPQVLAEVAGPADTILAAERVLLNFLQRLCGVATLTRRYVDAVAGSGAAILDTRKTTPGWRRLEKYAVRCGGGQNHRMGLYDAILVKDNHLAPYPPLQTAPAVRDMLHRARQLVPPPTFVEVEADSLDQVEQLLQVVGVNVILLDNFAVQDLRQAVSLRDAGGLRGKVRLEASGGVNLETVRLIAETGVDYISVGAITHSATALDLSLERITSKP